MKLQSEALHEAASPPGCNAQAGPRLLNMQVRLPRAKATQPGISQQTAATAPGVVGQLP